MSTASFWSPRGAARVVPGLLLTLAISACSGEESRSSSRLIMVFDADPALRADIDRLLIETDRGATSLETHNAAGRGLWPLQAPASFDRGKPRAFVRVRGFRGDKEIVRRSADIALDASSKQRVWSVYLSTFCEDAFRTCDEPRDGNTCIPCETTCGSDDVRAARLPALAANQDAGDVFEGPSGCRLPEEDGSRTAMDSGAGSGSAPDAAGVDSSLPPVGRDGAAEGGSNQRAEGGIPSLRAAFEPISVSLDHICAIVGPEKHVLCLGSNDLGQLGVAPGKEPSDWKTPVRVGGTSPLQGVRQVSVGFAFSCALLEDGHPYCWGGRDRFETGTHNRGLTHVPAPVVRAELGPANEDVPLMDIVQIVTSNRHGCALDTHGDVFCWGSNEQLQIGIGSSAQSVNGAVQVPLPDGARAKLLGRAEATTCAVTTDDAVYCWGENWGGMSGVRPDANDAGMITTDYVRLPHKLTIDPRILPITALVGGDAHMALLGAGWPWTWGSSFFGQLGWEASPTCPGNGDYPCSEVPGQVKPSVLGEGTGLATTDRNTCVVTLAKNLQCKDGGLATLTGVALGEVTHAAGAVARGLLCARTSAEALYCGGDLEIKNSQGSSIGTFTASVTDLVAVPLPDLSD